MPTLSVTRKTIACGQTAQGSKLERIEDGETSYADWTYLNSGNKALNVLLRADETLLLEIHQRGSDIIPTAVDSRGCLMNLKIRRVI